MQNMMAQVCWPHDSFGLFANLCHAKYVYVTRRVRVCLLMVPHRTVVRYDMSPLPYVHRHMRLFLEVGPGSHSRSLLSRTLPRACSGASLSTNRFGTSLIIIIMMIIMLLLLLGNGHVIDLWTKCTFSKIISKRFNCTSFFV